MQCGDRMGCGPWLRRPHKLRRVHRSHGLWRSHWLRRCHGLQRTHELRGRGYPESITGEFNQVGPPDAPKRNHDSARDGSAALAQASTTVL